MKRILLTTASAALIPFFAMAGSHSTEAEGTLKPMDETAQAEPAEGEGTDMAEEADPAAEGEDTDMVEEADPAAEGDDTDMAEEADPAAEGEGTDMAEEADPAAEGEDTDMAEEADPMTEGGDAAMAGADTDRLGIEGMVAVSNITGGLVYTNSAGDAENGWDTDMRYDAVSDEWERIGSIQDVILSGDGTLEGVVAEVGGFLGIGDKFVLLPMDEMKLVPLDESSYAVVTPFTADQLTEMESY